MSCQGDFRSLPQSGWESIDHPFLSRLEVESASDLEDGCYDDEDVEILQDDRMSPNRLRVVYTTLLDFARTHSPSMSLSDVAANYGDSGLQHFDIGAWYLIRQEDTEEVKSNFATHSHNSN